MTADENHTEKPENTPNGEVEQENGDFLTPWDVLAEAAAKFLQEPGITKAFGEIITAVAANKAKEPGHAKTTYGLGLLFGLLIFAGIGLLGGLKVIGPEATTGLLGSLIGYWYGRETNRPR